MGQQMIWDVCHSLLELLGDGLMDSAKRKPLSWHRCSNYWTHHFNKLKHRSWHHNQTQNL
jgi:hypothetical protein